MTHRNNYRLVSIAAKLVALGVASTVAGCSSGASSPKIPTPKAGRAAAFDLKRQSSKFNLDDAANGQTSGASAVDSAGNIYVLNNGFDAKTSDVLRMSANGKVSRFAKIKKQSTIPDGMTSDGKGGIYLGWPSGLIHLDRHGKSSPVHTSEPIRNVKPLGVRPDGALVVATYTEVLAIKDGKVAHLYKPQGKVARINGTVDPRGVTYVAARDNFSGMVQIAPDGTVHTVKLTVSPPRVVDDVTSLKPNNFAPATHGGAYVNALSGGEYDYALHIKGDRATIIAKGDDKIHNSKCKPGHEYPALSMPCSMPWFIAQSRNKVLLFGSGSHVPALAIKASDN